jgi:hypothetical protein
MNISEQNLSNFLDRTTLWGWCACRHLALFQGPEVTGLFGVTSAL